MIAAFLLAAVVADAGVDRRRLQELRGRLLGPPEARVRDLRGVLLRELRRFLVEHAANTADRDVLNRWWIVVERVRGFLTRYFEADLSSWKFPGFTWCTSTDSSRSREAALSDLLPPPGFVTGAEPFLPWAIRTFLDFGTPDPTHAVIRSIVDWFSATRPSLEGLSLGEARERAERWHASLKGEAGGSAGETVVEHRWDDGWTLVRLLDVEALRAETRALGHCVGESPIYANRLARQVCGYWSLRDATGASRVTIESGLEVESGEYTPVSVLQVRGRRNLRPFGPPLNAPTLRAVRLLHPKTVALWRQAMDHRRFEFLALLSEDELLSGPPEAKPKLRKMLVDQVGAPALEERLMQGSEPSAMLDGDVPDGLEEEEIAGHWVVQVEGDGSPPAWLIFRFHVRVPSRDVLLEVTVWREDDFEAGARRFAHFERVLPPSLPVFRRLAADIRAELLKEVAGHGGGRLGVFVHERHRFEGGLNPAEALWSVSQRVKMLLPKGDD